MERSKTIKPSDFWCMAGMNFAVNLIATDVTLIDWLMI
jgi:hypothetical protein